MNIRQDVIERFVRYAKIDTQSKDGVEDRYPSTEKQLDLARLLVDELREIGLEDIQLDAHGIVMASLPARIPEGIPPESVPCVGLLAHLDTYHEVSGKDVKPIVHADYQGGPLTLPGAADAPLTPEESPELLQFIGDEIVTSDGTTLLGADDKAGIAEIMTLMALYQSDPSLIHPRIRIGFTPDEEVGNGTAHFDVKKFGADVAYTMDGSGVGEVEDETFCADTAVVTIQGIDVHPGYAKNKMVNAVRLAADFIARIPGESVPETTDGRQDYLHAIQVQGNVSKTQITLLVRSFTEAGLEHLEQVLADIRRQVLEQESRARIDIEIKPSYRNMKQILDGNPVVVEIAEQAMRLCDLKPKRTAIRGGTDGARLSFLGLPTPNLSAGGFNFHGTHEWVPIGGMVTAVRVLQSLMQLWVERGQHSA